MKERDKPHTGPNQTGAQVYSVTASSCSTVFLRGKGISLHKIQTISPIVDIRLPATSQRCGITSCTASPEHNYLQFITAREGIWHHTSPRKGSKNSCSLEKKWKSLTLSILHVPRLSCIQKRTTSLEFDSVCDSDSCQQTLAMVTSTKWAITVIRAWGND